jgi:hypothetical protein
MSFGQGNGTSTTTIASQHGADPAGSAPVELCTAAQRTLGNTRSWDSFTATA